MFASDRNTLAQAASRGAITPATTRDVKGAETVSGQPEFASN
jgi:hypothetical protein